MGRAQRAEPNSTRPTLRVFRQAASENVKGTLRSRSQFRRVYDRGDKRVGKYVVVFVLQSPTQEGIQVGVVASRKVGDAVRRNRAKRLLRSAYREIVPELNKPCELILVARRSLVEPEVRSGAVCSELRATLDALGYLARGSDRNAPEERP